MSGLSATIVVLNDREPVPEGSVTFGQLIAEARQEKHAEQAMDRRTKKHHKLHVRHCRRYRIVADLVTWEQYVCRIAEAHTAWFVALDGVSRMDLCDYSRAARRDERFAFKKYGYGK